MPKLSALFLMQDPGKKFNMLLFKNNTKQRKPPKPTLCQRNAAWMPKLNQHRVMNAGIVKVHFAQVLICTCRQHRHHLK